MTKFEQLATIAEWLRGVDTPLAEGVTDEMVGHAADFIEGAVSIVDYLSEEARDYEAQGEPEHHIWHHLKPLYEALYG